MSNPPFASFGVTPPTGRCAATDEPIAPGTPYVACLTEVPGDPALSRIDFTKAAWDEGARPEPPHRVFAFWKAEMPDRDAPRKAVPEGALLDVLEHLEETEDPKRLAARYLIALTLIRRRVLVYEGGRPARTGVPGVIRVRRWTRAAEEPEPVFEVVDPGITPDELSAIAAELAELIPDEDDS